MEVKPEVKADEQAVSFRLTSTGGSFFVKVPPSKREVLKKLDGHWNQSRKSYSFLLSHLLEVETALGLPPGGSGLRDPNKYFPVIFSAEFEKANNPDLRKTLEAAGFKWNKHRKYFEGPLSKMQDVQKYIAK